MRGACFSAALLLLGCGGEGQQEAGDEPCGGRAERVVPGLVKQGATGNRVRMDALTPSPPARYRNDWVLSFEPPVSAASVEPFMVDHGHGAPIVPGGPGAEGGQLTFEDISLFMPGYWEVTVTPAEGSPVVFRVCVDG